MQYDIYDDFVPGWTCPASLGRKETMKNFYANCQYYATEEEAVKAASRAASKSQTEVKVYKAIKLVEPKAPDVTVSDVTI